jgi:hypothetical protein
MTTMTTITTAHDLHARILPHRPAVVDCGLVFDDLPAELEPVLSVLHTGVRALLSGRRWFGSTSADGRSHKNPRVVELDPKRLLPADIALLCVEGDDRWDRIHLAAPLDCPVIFKPEKAPAAAGGNR